MMGEQTSNTGMDARGTSIAGTVMLLNAVFLAVAVFVPNMWKISPWTPVLNGVCGYLLVRGRRNFGMLSLTLLGADLLFAAFQSGEGNRILLVVPALMLTGLTLLILGTNAKARVAGTVLVVAYGLGTLWLMMLSQIRWD